MKRENLHPPVGLFQNVKVHGGLVLAHHRLDQGLARIAEIQYNRLMAC